MQFAGAFGEQGVRYTLSVPAGAAETLSRQVCTHASWIVQPKEALSVSHDPDTLSLQVVKSDSATVNIPELELEIPAQTQKGVVTTVEGLLREAANGLAALQPERHASWFPDSEAMLWLACMQRVQGLAHLHCWSHFTSAADLAVSSFCPSSVQVPTLD